MNWKQDYETKFKSAEEAVAVVKDGDQVVYGEFAMASMTLDAAFAKRVPSLHNIILRSTTCLFPPKAVLADVKLEHVMYNDWHFSPASTALGGKRQVVERRMMSCSCGTRAAKAASSVIEAIANSP